jgi:hypothetical protein
MLGCRAGQKYNYSNPHSHRAQFFGSYFWQQVSIPIHYTLADSHTNPKSMYEDHSQPRRMYFMAPRVESRQKPSLAILPLVHGYMPRSVQKKATFLLV